VNWRPVVTDVTPKQRLELVLSSCLLRPLVLFIEQTPTTLFFRVPSVPSHRSRGLQQMFPVTDLVQGWMRELEATWGLEEEDNAGAEAELSHLLTRSEVHRLRKRLPHLNN
jgi:hypothetical protein